MKINFSAVALDHSHADILPVVSDGCAAVISLLSRRRPRKGGLWQASKRDYSAIQDQRQARISQDLVFPGKRIYSILPYEKSLENAAEGMGRPVFRLVKTCLFLF
jgi:hypothetical protein